MRDERGPVGKPAPEAVNEIGERLLSYMENTNQTIKPKRNMILDHQYQYVEPDDKRRFKLKRMYSLSLSNRKARYGIQETIIGQ